MKKFIRKSESQPAVEENLFSLDGDQENRIGISIAPFRYGFEAVRNTIKYGADLKNIIFHNMSNAGSTPWWNEDEWLATLPGWSRNQYHRVVQDMLDDSEIEREYNREVIPNLTRWVMRKRG